MEVQYMVAIGVVLALLAYYYFYVYRKAAPAQEPKAPAEPKAEEDYVEEDYVEEDYIEEEEAPKEKSQ